ncbi:MAG TPA: PEPxxWA-CTERM sorting domain-containing protein [Phenylobacterium sp.]|jgi:hypothetical protein
MILAMAAAVPADAAILAFAGSEMNDTPTPAPSGLCGAGQLLVSFSPGNAITSGASNFGAFGPSMTHCLTPPPTTYSGGVFEFDFAAGDEFSGTYSGFFSPTAVPNVLNSTVNYIVTGGTGRFLGATGTIQGVGTLDRNPVRPINNLTLSGVLNLPSVPEPSAWALMLAGFTGVGAMLRRRRLAAAAT